jgi:endonuclease YncB( thermonuclease family)
MLRVIRIDNKNINLEMVKSGLAEAYSGKPPKDFDLTPYPCVSMTRW